MRLKVLLSYPKLELNALNIVHDLIYFTLVCNVRSVPVEMLNFAMVKLDNFCKNLVITMKIKLFDGLDAWIVASKSERLTNWSLCRFNGIVIVMSKKVVFWLCRFKKNFGWRFWNLLTLARLDKRCEEIAQTVDQRTEFSFGYINLFVVVLTQMCLQFSKLEQLESKKTFWNFC